VEPDLARELWAALGPLAALGREAPEVVAALEALGLVEPLARELAVRGGPLLALGPRVVSAAFPEHDPAAVQAAVQAVLAGDLAAVADGGVAAAQQTGLRAAAARILGERAERAELGEAAAVLRRVAEAVDPRGGVLAAVAAARPWPGDGIGGLCHAASVLVEQRRAGWGAAALVAGLDGAEARVLALAEDRDEAGDGGRPALPRRGDEDPHAAAAARLAARGLLDRRGRRTATGRAVWASVQHHAEPLGVEPWRVLGAAQARRLVEGLAPLADAVRAALPEGSWRLDDALAGRRRTEPGGTAADGGGHRRVPDVRVLVVTGGVEVDEGAFFALFDDLPGVRWRAAAHPEAAQRLHPRDAGDADVLVFYDRPGLVLDPELPPRYLAPPERLVAGLHRLLGAGTGCVFLHHALAAWPGWPEYAEIVGGRFLHAADVVRGRRYPPSGVAGPVRQHLRVVADHPVTAGLDGGFDVVDVPYLCPMFEGSVVPLLRTDHPVTSEHFRPVREPAGGGEGDGVAGPGSPGTPGAPGAWWHPAGRDLAAWAKRYERSPVVYVQPGAGPATFAHPAYRQLLANAIRWVASPDARAWAASGAGAGAGTR